jgi:hypothetical protein
MKVNCYFERGALHWSNISAHNFVYNKLVEKYPEIEFHAIHTAVDLMPQPDGTYKSMREYTNYTGPACKYGPFWMVIQNTANNKFFVVSYWDKLNDFFHTNWDVENCVEILTGIGLHKNDIFYEKLDVKYTPTSFVGSTLQNEFRIEELYKQRMEMGKNSLLDRTKRKLGLHKGTDPYGRTYPEKLMFRGYTYLFRKHIINDERYVVHTDKVDEPTYLQELDSYALNFSPNGAGEICFRDFEVMGLGSALFRQKLVVDFHNKLIPNYHYISVDFDDIPKDTDYVTYWNKLADRIHERFQEVKDDHDFIDFVAKNGRKWYEENGTAEKNSEIIVSLLDLNKIK